MHGVDDTTVHSTKLNYNSFKIAIMQFLDVSKDATNKIKENSVALKLITCEQLC